MRSKFYVVVVARQPVAAVFFGLFSLLAFGVAAQDLAAADPPAAWLSHLGSCLKQVSALTAEVDLDAPTQNGLTRPRSGKVWLKRDGKLRLELGPEPRWLLVSDGSTLFSWDQDSRVSVRVPLESSLARPLAALLTSGGQRGNFAISHVGGTPAAGAGIAAIELVPRPKNAFVSSIVLALDSQCPGVRRAVVTSPSGSVLRLTFRNWKAVSGLAASLFSFSLPRRATTFTP